MAGMMDQLVGILTEQTERYEELLGLSKEKRDVIIENDVESLTKINHLENLVVSQAQKLEKKRMELIKDMAVVLAQKESDLTLTRLIELMEGKEESKSLIEARDRIKDVLDELKEVNSQNGQLIENALEYIEYSNNLIRTSVNQQPATYGSEDVYPDEAGYIDTNM